MTTTIEKHETLALAVCHALEELDAVGKSGTNKRDGYDFRTVDDVMAAVRSPFARNGVWLKPSFGRPRPVPGHEGEKFDPFFLEVDITLTLVHAHSDQRETIEGVGRGRMAGSGNVSLPDPRVIGQALSYGMKSMLINAFQLAGGDDSADTAEKADRPPPREERAPADPALEEARNGMLSDIAGLSDEVREALRVRLSDEKLTVRKATTMAELERIAVHITDLVELAETAGVPTDNEDQPNEPAEPSPDFPLTPEQEQAIEEMGPEAPPEPEPAPEPESERHLSAVPDDDRPPTAVPNVQPRGRAKAAAEQIAEQSEFNDTELAFIIGSDGRARTANAIVKDRLMVKQCLDLVSAIKSGKIIRQGLTLLDKATGEVVHDGSAAVATFRTG